MVTPIACAMKNRNLFNYLIALVLSVLVVCYYLLVFTPTRNVILEEIEQNFAENMRVESILMDNNILRFKEGARSLSSRSMIKKKLHAFKNGEITLDELKSYTQPKYADGVNSLDSCISAIRCIDTLIVAQVGQQVPPKRIYELKDSLKTNLIAGLCFNHESPRVYVISPIMAKSKLLGHDLAIYSADFLKSVHKNSHVQLGVFVKEGEDYRNVEGETIPFPSCFKTIPQGQWVKIVIPSQQVDARFVFSIKSDELYQQLYRYYQHQGLVFILLIFLFALVLFILHRRARYIFFNKKEFLEKEIKKRTATLNEKISEVKELNKSIDKKNTELFEALMQLRSKEKQLVKAEKIAMTGHWEFDLNTQRVFVSEGARKIYGLGTVREELTIPAVQKIPLPEYRDLLDQALSDLVHKNIPYKVDFKILNSLTGTVQDIHSEAEYNKEKNTVFGTIKDVTHELRLNEQLVSQNKALAEKNEKLYAYEAELMATNDELKNSLYLIQESEEKYRALYNNAPLAYQSLDANGCFIDVNPAWLNTLGYLRDEVIGKWFGDFLTDEMKALFKKRFEFFKKKGVVSGVQFRMVKKTGEVIIVSFEGCIGYDNKGNFKQTYCTFQEITRQYYAEQELKESEERFKALHNASFGGIAIHDHGTIIECNQGLSEMTGYTYKELVGADIFKIIAKESLQLVIEKIETFTEIPYEAQLKVKNGANMHALFKARNIPYKGKMVRTVEIRDITQEKEALNLIKKERNRAQNYLNVAGVIMVSLNKHGEVTLINQKGQDVLGYNADELVGKNWFDTVVAETNCEEIKLLFNQLIAGKLESAEYVENTVITKNGEELVISWYNALLYNEKGEVEGTLSSGEDITEKKAVELKLIENEARFKGLFDNMRSGVAIYKPVKLGEDFEFVGFNQAAKEITGLKNKNMIGNSLLSEFPNMKNAPLFKGLKKVHKTGEGLYIPPFYYADEKREGWRENKIYKIPTGEIVAIFDDVTESHQNELVTQARVEVTNYANNHNVNEVLVRILDELETITQSKIGFYTFVNEDDGTLELNAWSTNTTKTMCQTEAEGIHYPIAEAGVWVDCIKERKPVIHNNYASLPHKKGLPLGHAPVIRELLIPVLRNNKIVAVVAVGNKPLNYNNNDIKYAQKLADSAFDIILRKRTEQELKESEERLKLSIEGSNLGIWDWNISTNEITLNEQWASMLGYSLKELEPTSFETWAKLCHPDDLEESNKKINEHLEGKTKSYDCEVRAKHKKGHWVWILDKGKIVARNSKNQPIRMSGTHLDITERKRAEQIKRESEQRFKAMFYDNTSVMLLIDPKMGHIVDANKTATVFYGYSIDELKNMRIQQINTMPANKVEQEMEKAFKMNQNFFIFRHRLASGKIKDVQVYSSPLTFDNKHVLFSIIQDITAQKIVEEALQQNQQQLQLIFDNSPAMMMLLNEQTEILKINQAGLKFTDILIAKAEGKKTGDVFQCVHAAKHSKGCGYGENCEHCTLRNTIKKTMDTGKSYQNIEATLNVYRNGKPFTLTVLIATTLASAEPEKTLLVTLDDITDQKRAQQTLMDNERRFRAIIEGANDAVIIADAKTGMIKNANKKAEELTGHNRSELIGLHQTKLHPLERKLHYENEFQKNSNSSEDSGLRELEIYHASGKIIPVEVNASRIELLSQTMVVGFFRDITQRKKAEKELAESLTKFKTLADYTYDWEYWKGPDGNYIYISPACQRISGYTVADFEKTPTLFQQRVLNEDAPIWLAHENETENKILTKNPVDIRFRTKSGRVIWINHVCRQVFDDNKNFLGYRGVNRDITNQKQAQLQLEESNERFKQLADFTYEGILIHQNGVILDANTSMLKMSGYTMEEIKGKNILKHFMPEKYHAMLQEKMQQKKVKPYQVELKNKAGETLQVEITARAISMENNEVRVVAVRDITEQKQMQQRILKAIIETEEAERKRVAQELHDGLGPVLSTVKLYTETYLKSTNEAFKEKIEGQLLTGVDDAINLVSQISNNLSPHILQDFGLKTALERFVERIEKITSLNINLVYPESLRFKEEIKITLYRVIIELLNNTVKHAKANKVSIVVIRKGDFYKVTYTDNGKGFDLEHVKLKKKGMGLFNILQRINALGGEVDFEQLTSNGIKYTISIPYNIANSSNE